MFQVGIFYRRLLLFCCHGLILTGSAIPDLSSSYSHLLYIPRIFLCDLERQIGTSNFEGDYTIGEPINFIDFDHANIPLSSAVALQ